MISNIESSLLKKGDWLLIAVSGGPDSVALLYILKDLQRELNLKLFIGHLSHMIRPEAAKDTEFVEKLGKKLRIPVIAEVMDVPKFAKQTKRSLEDAARVARYDFFMRAAKETGANKIALAHTQDDQAETVLMRLLRGSGLLGLSGMPARRDLGGIEIIRPFINVTKKEILRFLSRRKTPFRKDATNLQPIYLRNKIRLKLIPFIEKEFEPNIQHILADTSANLRVDYDYLAHITSKKFKAYAKVADGRVYLDERFLKENPAIQRMIIREAIKRAKGDLASVTYSHWRVLDKLLKKKKRWAVSLPGNITVKKTADKLIFSGRSDVAQETFDPSEVTLTIPGNTDICGSAACMLADFVKPQGKFKNKKSMNVEYFDADRLEFPLKARFRRATDRIQPIGMTAQKRLKTLFIDEKVPFENRSRIPLVVSGGKVIWACGVKRSDHAKISPATKKALRLKFLKY